MNPDEKHKIHKVGIAIIRIRPIGITNAFGVTNRVLDDDGTARPCLLGENGRPVLWEDRTKILLEQQKIKTWRQTIRK